MKTMYNPFKRVLRYIPPESRGYALYLSLIVVAGINISVAASCTLPTDKEIHARIRSDEHARAQTCRNDCRRAGLRMVMWSPYNGHGMQCFCEEVQ